MFSQEWDEYNTACGVVKVIFARNGSIIDRRTC